MDDEYITFEPTEEELTLYYLSDMLDTLIEQMMWLREVVEQEIKRTSKDRASRIP